jgi:hypothetical protein
VSVARAAAGGTARSAGRDEAEKLVRREEAGIVGVSAPLATCSNGLDAIRKPFTKEV